MKGLLHRLAARATGTIVTVRSDARLALGGLGPVHSAADAAGGPSLAFETGRAVQSAQTPATARADASHDHLPAPIIGPVPPGLQAPRFEPAPWSDASAGGHAGEALSDAAVLNLPATAPPRLVDYSVDHGRVSPLLSCPAFGPTPWTADPRLPEGLRPESAIRVVREPPLLMPLTTTDRTPVPGLIAGGGTRTPVGVLQHADRSEERDVHIHIGCVEVTAVHEPAARRRQPVSTPPSMSLDAYLAKRVRG